MGSSSGSQGNQFSQDQAPPQSLGTCLGSPDWILGAKLAEVESLAVHEGLGKFYW